MRRPFALRTEVFAGFDQAASEVLLPNPVDRNARRERIVLADQPLGEAEPVRRRVRRHTAQYGGHAAVYLLVLIGESSADAHEIGWTRNTRSFPHNERGGDSEAVHLLLQFLEPLARRFEPWSDRAELFGNLLAFVRGAIGG